MKICAASIVSGSRRNVLMQVREKTLRIALLGVFSGIIILMTLTSLGYLPIGPVAVTLIHIPVIVGTISLSYRQKLGRAITNGAILGGVMGITCMFKAAVFPTSVTDPLFINPLLSLFPRIALGIVAAVVFRGVHTLFKGKEGLGEGISAGIAAIAATLTNTVLVLSMLGLLYGQDVEKLGEGFVSFGATLTSIFMTIIATNGLLEILSAVVVAVPVCLALFAFQRKMNRD